MRTKVSKWGNSLALRIPKQIAKNYQLKDGVEIEITEKEEGVFIEPMIKKYSLKGLLDQVTQENRHSETISEKPVGKEIW